MIQLTCRTVWMPAMQDGLLLVAMQLMMGGSLRTALVNPGWQDALHWDNW